MPQSRSPAARSAGTAELGIPSATEWAETVTLRLQQEAPPALPGGGGTGGNADDKGEL